MSEDIRYKLTLIVNTGVDASEEDPGYEPSSYTPVSEAAGLLAQQYGAVGVLILVCLDDATARKTQMGSSGLSDEEEQAMLLDALLLSRLRNMESGRACALDVDEPEGA
jgi:hypothetical protein